MNENGPRLGHGPSTGHHVAVSVLHFLLGVFRRALHLLAAALDILVRWFFSLSLFLSRCGLGACQRWSAFIRGCCEPRTRLACYAPLGLGHHAAAGSDILDGFEQFITHLNELACLADRRFRSLKQPFMSHNL